VALAALRRKASPPPALPQLGAHHESNGGTLLQRRRQQPQEGQRNELHLDAACAQQPSAQFLPPVFGEDDDTEGDGTATEDRTSTSLSFVQAQPDCNAAPTQSSNKGSAKRAGGSSRAISRTNSSAANRSLGPSTPTTLPPAFVYQTPANRQRKIKGKDGDGCCIVM
jgi:hypothetical protein